MVVVRIKCKIKHLAWCLAHRPPAPEPCHPSPSLLSSPSLLPGSGICALSLSGAVCISPWGRISCLLPEVVFKWIYDCAVIISVPHLVSTSQLPYCWYDQHHQSNQYNLSRNWIISIGLICGVWNTQGVMQLPLICSYPECAKSASCNEIQMKFEPYVGDRKFHHNCCKRWFKIRGIQMPLAVVTSLLSFCSWLYWGGTTLNWKLPRKGS